MAVLRNDIGAETKLCVSGNEIRDFCSKCDTEDAEKEELNLQILSSEKPRTRDLNWGYQIEKGLVLQNWVKSPLGKGGIERHRQSSIARTTPISRD